MPEVKTAPVQAQLVDSIVADDAPAGSIKFYKTADHEPAGFHFQCPCGCGKVGAVSVRPGGWEWNGSREKPTVRPSVRLKDGRDNSHWHGWLTDGIWSSC